MAKSPHFCVLGLIIFLLLISLVIVVVSRNVSPKEYDDAHPLILDVDHPLIQESEWVWVVPLYMGVPLTDYPIWVDKLKKSGKKLGLHGIHHTYDEFGKNRSWNYVYEGVKEFEKAFGYKPSVFKAPKLSMTPHNRDIVEDMGMEIVGRYNQIIHAVSHTDTDRLSDGRLIGEFKES